MVMSLIRSIRVTVFLSVQGDGRGATEGRSGAISLRHLNSSISSFMSFKTHCNQGKVETQGKGKK
jgi:hypothetical protein